MDTLPYELLEIIAGYITLTDISSLIRVSKKWFGICNSDRFWLNRLAQDYPQYTERLTFPVIYHAYMKRQPLTPKELYRLLSISINLRNDDGERILQPIDINVGREFCPISLVYPVPLFGYQPLIEGIEEEMRWMIYNDVQIAALPKVALIVTFDRRCLLSPPRLGKNIPQLDRYALPDFIQEQIEDSIAGLYNTYDMEFGEIIVIKIERLPQFLRDAQDKGYLQCDDESNNFTQATIDKYSELFYNNDDESESDDD